MQARYLYEGPKSRPEYNTWDWQEYPPKPMKESVAKSLEENAITIYRIKDKDKRAVGDRYPLKTRDIIVHDRMLIKAMAPILKKHGKHVDVNISLKLEPPFEPLFFSMSEFLALHKATRDDSPLKRLLELLVKVLDDLFFSTQKEVRALRAQKLISFKHAWTYFPTGTVLYTYGRNTEMLSEVVECSQRAATLNLTVKLLVFDGTGFVWRKKELIIPTFDDNLPITELSHYPLEFHEDPESVKRHLTERGKMVLDLQGLHYRTYDGIAQDGNDSHNVEGRILIDVIGYNKYHLAQGKREVGDPETVRNAETKRVILRGKDTKDDKKSIKRLSEEEQACNKAEMLEKKDFLKFIGPLIEGYALKNKKWCKWNAPEPWIRGLMSPSVLLRRGHLAHDME